MANAGPRNVPWADTNSKTPLAVSQGMFTRESSGTVSGDVWLAQPEQKSASDEGPEPEKVSSEAGGNRVMPGAY